MAVSNQTALILEEVAFLQGTYAYGYCDIATAALIFFDYILTISQEARFVWSSKFSLPKIVFLLNRYLLIVMGLANIVGSFWWSTPMSCEATSSLQDATIIALETVIAIFSALRVYAITGGKWLPALLTVLCGVIPAGLNIYTHIADSYDHVVYIGSYPVCDANTSLSVSEEQRLITVGRVCSIASDLIVLVATWLQTFRHVRQALQVDAKAPIGMLLIRDGTLYFLTLLVFNILEVVIAARYQNAENYAAYISAFITPQVANDSDTLNWHTRSVAKTRESLQFASRLVGNMDGDLDFESPDQYVDDEDNSADDGVDLEHADNVEAEMVEIRELYDANDISEVPV